MNITAVLRECAVDLLDTELRVDVDQVVSCAYRRHGEVFAEAQEQMVRAMARRTVASLMRDLSEDENEQQSFPGMAGLPSAIAVQTPDGTYYVRSDKATWTEVLAGRSVRAANVAAAQAKLDAYDEAVETLRPYMESHPTISVAEALHLMGNEAA